MGGHESLEGIALDLGQLGDVDDVSLPFGDKEIYVIILFSDLDYCRILYR